MKDNTMNRQNKFRIAKLIIAFLVISLIILEGTVFIWANKALPLRISVIKNTANIKSVYWDVDFEKMSSAQRKTIFGNLSPVRKQKLREKVAPAVEGSRSSLQKYIAIRKWARSKAKVFAADTHSDDPLEILEQLEQGEGALCGELAKLMIGACQSLDLPARYVHLMRSPDDKWDTHVTVEVWVNHKWIVMDPTFNSYFTIRGSPASALEINQLLLKYSKLKTSTALLKSVRDGATTEPTLSSYYINPIRIYRYPLYLVEGDFEPTDPFVIRVLRNIMPGEPFGKRRFYFYYSKNDKSSPFLIYQIIRMFLDFNPLVVLVLIISYMGLLIAAKRTKNGALE